MKKIFYCLLSILCFANFGCRKFLTQEPYNNISITDVFKDVEGARTTLTGCYNSLASTNYYLRTFSIYPEVTAGNIKYSRSANQALITSYNFNNDVIVNDMTNFYRTAYAIIYNCNTIIANINNIADANNLQKNKFLADAYCIRALVHFDLARVFSQANNYSTDASHPAITIKNVLSPITSQANPLSSSKEVFSQITNDIDSAIGLYPNSSNIFTLGDAKTYFSLEAAKALKSRVALYKNDWTTTVTLSTDIISSNKYSLIPTSNYVASWSKKNISSESIFELSTGNRISTYLSDYYNPKSTFGQLATTTDLLNLYSIGDVRAKATMFFDSSINSTFYSFTKKYQDLNENGNNIKIIRLSELYLNRAEAYAELDNLTAALTDLNLIRKRGLPSATNFTSTDKQVVLNEIFNERRRELCFEGHAFFDFSRKQKNIVRTDCISTICSFTYPNSKYACIIPQTN
jgi:starch-binding outer membrane protein, SusD/RagB family